MENMIKKSLYTGAGLVFGGLYSVKSALAATSDSTFGTDKASTTAGQLEDQTLSEAIQTYINYIMTFLYLIAVMYALWGGFNILTAGGNEEKVKKGKTILIQGALGLLVIWLAGTIVSWVLGLLDSGTPTT